LIHRERKGLSAEEKKRGGAAPGTRWENVIPAFLSEFRKNAPSPLSLFERKYPLTSNARFVYLPVNKYGPAGDLVGRMEWKMREKTGAPPKEDQSARIRVLIAATQLFTQRGYAATSVREIVESAGVTKPILYYYFGNKEGIYLEILNGLLRQFKQLIADVRKLEGTPRQNILNFGTLFYRGFKEHLAEARLFHSIYYGPQQGAPHFEYELLYQEFVKVVKALVAQAVQMGEYSVRQSELLVWTIMAAINFANESQLIKNNHKIGEAGLESMLKMVLQGASSAEAAGTMVHSHKQPGKRSEGRKRNVGKKL
jgi:TetR/AcrR family transcriptional regulator